MQVEVNPNPRRNPDDGNTIRCHGAVAALRHGHWLARVALGGEYLVLFEGTAKVGYGWGSQSHGWVECRELPRMLVDASPPGVTSGDLREALDLLRAARKLLNEPAAK
jgi:hypothetical protein